MSEHESRMYMKRVPLAGGVSRTSYTPYASAEILLQMVIEGRLSQEEMHTLIDPGEPPPRDSYANLYCCQDEDGSTYLGISDDSSSAMFNSIEIHEGWSYEAYVRYINNVGVILYNKKEDTWMTFPPLEFS